MKVYTKLVFDLDGNRIEEDSYEYFGPVSECKGPSQQTSTTTMAPPKYLQPYYKDIASEASNLYKNTDIQGQQVAGFSPETNQAFGMISNRATSGSPLNQAAQDQAMSTIRGDFMNSPQFMSQFQAAANKINPQIDSIWSRSGRMGSGLADAAKTEALGNAYAGLVGQERQNQMAMTQFAPQLAQQDYFDASQLANVGMQREAQEQDVLNAKTANSRLPWDELGMFSGLLQGIPGGTQTSAQPLYRNRLSGALGGAMAGGAMLGPWGALGGGLLGAFQ